MQKGGATRDTVMQENWEKKTTGKHGATSKWCFMKESIVKLEDMVPPSSTDRGK